MELRGSSNRAFKNMLEDAWRDYDLSHGLPTEPAVTPDYEFENLTPRQRLWHRLGYAVPAVVGIIGVVMAYYGQLSYGLSRVLLGLTLAFSLFKIGQTLSTITISVWRSLLVAVGFAVLLWVMSISFTAAKWQATHYSLSAVTPGLILLTGAIFLCLLRARWEKAVAAVGTQRHLWWSAVWAISFFLGSLVGAAPYSSSIGSLYAKIDSWSQKVDHLRQQSVSGGTTYAHIYKSDAAADLALAQEQFQYQKFEQAAKLADEAVTRWPYDIDAISLSTSYQERAHGPAFALNYLEKYLASFQNEPRLQLQRAVLLAKNGRSQEAVPLFEDQLVRGHGTDDDVRAYLDTMLQKNAASQALKTLSEVLKYRQSAKLGRYQAVLLAEVGRFDEAISQLQGFLKMDGFDPLDAWKLGDVALKARRSDIALSAVERLLKEGFDVARTHTLAGEAHELAGRTKEATEAYKKALEKDSSYSSALDGLKRVDPQANRAPAVPKNTKKKPVNTFARPNLI